METARTELNTFDYDRCCNALMRKADLSSIETWTCPKCCCEWRPRVVGDVRHWEAHPIIEVFKGICV